MIIERSVLVTMSLYTPMQIAEYVLLSVIIALGALAYFNIIG
jgi:hypothetical protein